MSPISARKQGINGSIGSNKRLYGEIPIKKEPVASQLSRNSIGSTHQPGQFSRRPQGVVAQRQKVIEHITAVTVCNVNVLTQVDLVQDPTNSYHVIAQAVAALEGHLILIQPEPVEQSNTVTCLSGPH